MKGVELQELHYPSLSWAVMYHSHLTGDYPTQLLVFYCFRLLVGNLKGEYVTECFEEGLPPHPYKDALFAYVIVAIHLLSFTLHSCL